MIVKKHEQEKISCIFIFLNLTENHWFCSVRVISTAVFENNQKYQVKFEGKTKINLPPQQWKLIFYFS